MDPTIMQYLSTPVEQPLLLAAGLISMALALYYINKK